MTNTQAMEDIIWEALEENGMDVKSFRSAGVLSNNSGLVVTLEDGSEFQLTIVKSK